VCHRSALPQELSVINALAAEYKDVWRELHPDEKNVFTVWDERTNARATNQGLRIDFMLCSRELQGKVANCQVNLQMPQDSRHGCALLASVTTLGHAEVE
jgi:exonuclease III